MLTVIDSPELESEKKILIFFAVAVFLFAAVRMLMLPVT